MQTSYLTEHDQSPTCRLSKTQESSKPTVLVFNVCFVTSKSVSQCVLLKCARVAEFKSFLLAQGISVQGEGVKSGKYGKDQLGLLLKPKIIIFFK